MFNRKIITNYHTFLLLEQKVFNKDGEEVPQKEIQKKFKFLRKEPKYLQLFFNIHELEEKSIEELQELYDRILHHRNTLKQNNVDLTKLETSEQINDELDKMDLVHKTTKFVNKIPNPLRNKIKQDLDALKQFSNMIINYDYEDYKNVFLKKIAKYKDLPIEDFFTNFKRHLKNLAPIKETIEDIKKDPGAEIVYFDEDEYIIALIYSVKSSCNLGSAQWCISNSSAENMWSSYIIKGYGAGYTNTGVGVQYFIWDLTVEPHLVEHKVGATIYDNRSDDFGHNLDDSRVNDLKSRGWYQYLKPFNELEKYQQVKLVAENPKMEEKLNVISRLNTKEKRDYIFKYPKLIKYVKDMGTFTNKEIWNMVKTDSDIARYEHIANQLNDEQKIQVIVNDPEILELNFDDPNIYTNVKKLLTREQKIKMVSNRHSLLKNIDLTDPEILQVIELDPTILVTYTELIKSVDNIALKELYINNKKSWDKKISKSKSKNMTKAELLLTHLIKDEARIKKEYTKKCYFFVGRLEKNNGKQYLVPLENSNVVYVKDVLNPDPMNNTLFRLIEKAENSNQVDLYSSWVSLDVDDVFLITSSVDDFLSENVENKKELEFFNQIQSDYTSYAEVS